MHLVSLDSGSTDVSFLSLSHSGDPAWKRLMNSPLPLDGQISLITEILSDPDETEVVKGLSGDEAQSFVDVVDKVLPFSLHKDRLDNSDLRFVIVPSRCWIA